MSTLSERLQEALAGPPKLKQVDLAAACGIKPPSVSDWLNGRTLNIEGKNLLAASRFLGVRPEWLSKGSGPMRPTEQPNTSPGPDLRGSVPLISWVQAGSWCEVVDNLSPGDAEQWLPCPMPHGKRAFCLRVAGDSMMPDYRDGEIILVEPDMAGQHGDDVVARTPEGQATFKRLQITPDGTYLLALNPDWQPRRMTAPPGTRICGVVTGSWMDRRRR